MKYINRKSPISATLALIIKEYNTIGELPG